MQDPPSQPQPTKPGHGPTGLGRGDCGARNDQGDQHHPPQPPSPQISTQQSHLKHRTSPTITGRQFLAGSALGCVVLFFVVWGTIRSVEQHVRDNRPVLTWVDRESWHAPAVIQATLVKPNAANVQYTYNKPRYRDPGFVISPEEEAAVLAYAKLAADPGFTDLSNEDFFYGLADSSQYFYAKYLLATRYSLGNDSEKSAPNLYQQATDLAPKIIVIRYTDAQGNPVPDLKLDRIEIGCDRVTNEGTSLNQRLVLIYPNLTTDATGRVYLPVYDTTYRLVYLSQPDGYQITYTPNEGWFKLPTRLGTINARVNTTHE
jgi:hypothetical protein